MMKQLVTALGVLVGVALASLGVGWYAGTATVERTAERLAADIGVQAQRVAALESTVTLLTDEALALREALAEQELLAAEAAVSLRTALDEQARQQATALADLADDVDVTGLVEVWSPYVYDITCDFDGRDGNDDTTGSGSATLVRDTLGTIFITNAHVVEDETGGVLARCKLERNDADAIVVGGDRITVAPEHDIAYGIIADDHAAMDVSRLCMTPPRIGERVIILGYPKIGAKESVTVTEGIISGFDEDFYTTSAKIEKGNSGGAAVSLERDCFLGIPTLVVAGRIESIARILPIMSIER